MPIGKTFKEMTRGQEIAPDKRTKYYLTKSVCRLLSLLAPIQDHRFEEKLGRTNSTTILFHPRALEKRYDFLCTTSLLRTIILLYDNVPDCISPSDDVRATVLQEDDGVAYAGQASDG